MADIKTTDQVKSDLISVYGNLDDKLDLTKNKVERDVLVEAPADGAIGDLWSELDNTSKAQSFDNVADLSNADIDALASNYNRSRNDAVKATSAVFFYTDSSPTADITVASGVIVSTSDDNPVTFETTESKTMYSATPDIYYQSSLGLWGIELSVRAISAGENGNKSAGLITTLSTSVSGITSVNNVTAATGGSEEESNASLISRVKARFEGEDLSTRGGLRDLMLDQDNVTDALIVGANHSFMTRDEGYGGSIDIYILGSDSTTTSETVTVTSTGYVLTSQPVISVSSVIGDSSYTETTDYTFVADTANFAGSTLGQDKILFTSTGPSVGEDITVTYNYNALMATLQNLFTIDANDIVNSDNLVKSTTEVTIDITIAGLVLNTGYDLASVKNSINTALTNLINALGLGDAVELADILGTIKSVAGVDNLDTRMANTYITPSGGGTVNAQGDVILTAKEYPRMGTPTYT